jgi:phosphotransferase system  glucose/maltose/N-acetylglucosamine-specific IIC component
MRIPIATKNVAALGVTEFIGFTVIFKACVLYKCQKDLSASLR